MFGITFLLVAGYDSMTKSRSRFCSKKKVPAQRLHAAKRRQSLLYRRFFTFVWCFLKLSYKDTAN